MKHARSDYDQIQDPHHKIGEDEPVFLLRAKDKFAPLTLRTWASQVRAGGDTALADHVDNWAFVMEEWQRNNKVHVPDVPQSVFKKHSIVPDNFFDDIMTPTVFDCQGKSIRAFLDHDDTLLFVAVDIGVIFEAMHDALEYATKRKKVKVPSGFIWYGCFTEMELLTYLFREVLRDDLKPFREWLVKQVLPALHAVPHKEKVQEPVVMRCVDYVPKERRIAFLRGKDVLTMREEKELRTLLTDMSNYCRITQIPWLRDIFKHNILLNDVLRAELFGEIETCLYDLSVKHGYPCNKKLRVIEQSYPVYHKDMVDLMHQWLLEYHHNQFQGYRIDQ